MEVKGVIFPIVNPKMVVYCKKILLDEKEYSCGFFCVANLKNGYNKKITINKMIKKTWRT